MKSLCPYRNILGKVREGVHAYRFMHIAIVDVLMTVVGAYNLLFRHNPVQMCIP
jgi:hypothetical protein